MAKVLCVSVAQLRELLGGDLFQGWSPVRPHVESLTLSGVLARAELVERDAAEHDPTYKQLIPYVMLRHRGLVLTYARTSGSGESRLLGRISVGFGGHIEETDLASSEHPADSFDARSYSQALERELYEELSFPFWFAGMRSHSAHGGWINDDSNEVGRVHLGVVHIQEYPAFDVASNDPAVTILGFADPRVLLRMGDQLETWSRLLLEGLTTTE